MITIIFYNLLISLLGFGGGTVFLVYIYDYYVSTDLLSVADYNYFTSIAYILPGPLSIKVISLTDYQLEGYLGYIVGVSALIVPTIFFIYFSYRFLSNKKFNNYLIKLGRFIGPVIAGMILYFTLQFLKDTIEQNVNIYIFTSLIIFDLVLYYLIKLRNNAILISINLILAIILLTIL